jgi:uncharacterized membrane protein YfcA
MEPDGATIAVVLVVFVATLVRSTFGFGEALVAVPLLALFIPVDRAVPLATLVSVVVAAVVVLQDRDRIHLGSAARLVLATLVGIPLGVWLLAAGADAIVRAVLGIVLVAFSAFCLAGGVRAALKTDQSAWAFGLAAGVLGGAYGMNGPPLVVYGALRRWTPQHFRATLQGYFLPASLVGLGGYALAGLWTKAVTRDFLWCVPGVLIAIPVGRAANRRLLADTFLRWVHAGLILIGLVLIGQALR